jgi:hypothetical protein
MIAYFFWGLLSVPNILVVLCINYKHMKTLANKAVSFKDLISSEAPFNKRNSLLGSKEERQTLE